MQNNSEYNKILEHYNLFCVIRYTAVNAYQELVSVDIDFMSKTNPGEIGSYVEDYDDYRIDDAMYYKTYYMFAPDHIRVRKFRNNVQLPYDSIIDVPDGIKYAYIVDWTTVDNIYRPWAYAYTDVYFDENEAVNYIQMLYDRSNNIDKYTPDDRIRIYKIPLRRNDVDYYNQEQLTERYYNKIDDHKNDTPDELYDWCMEFCDYEERTYYNIDIYPDNRDLNCYKYVFTYGNWALNGFDRYKSYEDFSRDARPSPKRWDIVMVRDYDKDDERVDIYKDMMHYVDDYDRNKYVVTDGPDTNNVLDSKNPLCWARTVYLSTAECYDKVLESLSLGLDIVEVPRFIRLALIRATIKRAKERGFKIDPDNEYGLG